MSQSRFEFLLQGPPASLMNSTFICSPALARSARLTRSHVRNTTHGCATVNITSMNLGVEEGCQQESEAQEGGEEQLL